MNTVKDMCSDRLKNAVNVEENLGLVEPKLKILSCRKSELRKKVTKAVETGRRKRKREVENWFKEVKQTKNEFNELKRSVVKIGAKVERLLEQSKDFEDQLWLYDHENRGEHLLARENLFGQMFRKGRKTICDWLIKDDLFNIGIYGVGGVGKTTLAKCIHNHLLEKRYFKIFWVTVSQDFSIKKLQDDVAKQVLVDLSSEDDENKRAAMLSRAIRNQSLLILDDVWEVFSLEDVGIPSGLNNCRLIWTTRSSQVCDRMSFQKLFKVITLDEGESWDLFRHTLGHETKLSEEVVKIAKSVANRCAGIPLGIITTASSMRGVRDICEWNIVLEQLKSSSDGHHEMEDEVFPILESSFKRLRGCERSCFLYCCLYPKDDEIEREQLIDLFIFAELIPRRDTMELERSDGHRILNKLVKVCLLEEVKNGRGDECVRMHDVIRDMALRITSGRYNSKNTQGLPRFLVKSGIENSSNHQLVELTELKDDLVAVSLMSRSNESFGKILEIPPLMSPNCQNLSTLIINGANIREIPNSFLQHMCGLKVLNLEWCVHLKLLPNCISDTVNITALLLEGCWCLESVPPLGKLKKLRTLNLLCTKVDDLPQGLEELVNLERLYMGGGGMGGRSAIAFAVASAHACRCALRCERGHPPVCVRALPEGTFSKLYRLQHLVLPAAVHISDLLVLNELQLYVGGLSYDQCSKFGWWPTHFKMSICDVDPNYSFGHGYGSFERINEVADCWRQRWENQLLFEGCNFEKGLDVVLPPENLHTLELYRCSGLLDVFSHRWLDKSKDLYNLYIQDLDDLKFVLNLSSPDDEDEEVASNFEGALRNMSSPDDDDDKEVASSHEGALRNLSSPDDDDEEVASNREGALCNLRRIYLFDLPNLVGLISMGRISVGSLIPPVTFSSLEELHLYNCHGMKELFSVRLVQKCLQNLKFSEVGNCGQVEEIVADNDDQDTSGGGEATISQPSSSGPIAPTSQELILPKLRFLSLDKLSKLENVCNPTIKIGGDKPMAFELINCPKLKRLPSFSSAKITYEIEGSNEWWNSLEWNNPSDKDAVQPFFKVYDPDWMMY